MVALTPIMGSTYSQPVLEESALVTRWSADVSADTVLPEYPRPQMTRDAWMNLNGEWEYAIVSREADAPAHYDGKILVPFPVESQLSGVKKSVGSPNRLWYRRSLTIPSDWKGQRVLLHFGAADWETTVYLNGKELGSHRGGYAPFSFDITDAIQTGTQELEVAVWDPTSDSYQPRGKQVNEPKSIWYTAVTGIWQTVWMEPVPKAAITELRITPDLDAEEARIVVKSTGGEAITLKALDKGKVVATAQGRPNTEIALAISAPKTWSPDSPFLYDLQVVLSSRGKEVDTVGSYFGMRKISLGKDKDGIKRLFLNNEPLFHFGPLDQGWWPDGLYTAPTDEALRYDVEITKNSGFNMARKHVKVEPARWYYHCDKIGLMVWQDMPSGDNSIRWDMPDLVRSKESEDNFYHEWGEIMDALHNFPSIVMWVPFNEGWGQFDTNTVSDWTKRRDPTRLVNQSSGWADRKGGDVYDKHSYPIATMFPIEENRASVLGEFGGLGLPLEGHLWWDKRNWGYRTHKSKEELQQAYEKLIVGLPPLIGRGLAAAIYTQTSDVEGEVNGLMTYDRAIIKMGIDWLANINSRVFEPTPTVRNLLPTSEKEGLLWHYTFDQSDAKDGWEQPDFDDGGWEEGPGMFGSDGAYGTWAGLVRTQWRSSRIWLRRTFNISEKPEGTVLLYIHHNDDAEVYLNGVLAAKVQGASPGFIPVPLIPESMSTLKRGDNTIAIHARQKRAGQCIDAGLLLIEE